MHERVYPGWKGGTLYMAGYGPVYEGLDQYNEALANTMVPESIIIVLRPFRQKGAISWKTPKTGN